MKCPERYPTPRVEANALTLEKALLIRLVSRSNADCALCIHNALPRDSGARRQRMERVTYQACLPRQAGEARYLAVGGYAAARYSRHDIVDAAM
ncbi:MAG TPA: hypothetical protein VGO75_15910 [Gemmatimonadaceae bacterium]|nr:hypothetical protein [Gemmatimonadaceae bacterium]